MADFKKISDELINQLNVNTESHYSAVTNDMKGMIINVMDSTRLTEIDFTRGTGLASEGVWSYYGSIKISIVKMTWDGCRLMFYYYHAPDELRPEILRNITYDAFVASGKKYVSLHRVYDIICHISYILDYLANKKEVTVILSNGNKVICNVPKHVIQKENLVDYIKHQTKDFSERLNEAIENGQYTYDDIN